MNRHAFCLEAAQSPRLTPLIDLARMLVHTLEQNEAEGTDAQNDPATLVLGAFIGFQTHADVNTFKGYKELLSLCELRLNYPPELQ